MKEQKDMFGLLDMMLQPVFCVKDNTVLRCNAAARQLLGDLEGAEVPLTAASAEEYAAFSEGRLYLTLTLAGQQMGASVRKLDDLDVFELDPVSEDESLRAMALAARELRKPLSAALSSTATLLDSQEDPDALEQLSRLNRGLYQMLRTIGNMSDAGSVSSHCSMDTVDIPAVFREIFEKAQVLASQAGILLTWQDLPESLYGLADRDLLERAVLNILSNAMKFTPQGGEIRASLTRRGRTLRLTVEDSGSGIDRDVMGNLFQRHLRQPGLEDSRFGVGLGIRLIHSAARHHGGTLLISSTETGGSRIVLTLSIRQKGQDRLSSPVFSLDYTGGFDHALVELSDVLPATLYDDTF